MRKYNTEEIVGMINHTHWVYGKKDKKEIERTRFNQVVSEIATHILTDVVNENGVTPVLNKDGKIRRYLDKNGKPSFRARVNGTSMMLKIVPGKPRRELLDCRKSGVWKGRIADVVGLVHAMGHRQVKSEEEAWEMLTGAYVCPSYDLSVLRLIEEKFAEEARKYGVSDNVNDSAYLRSFKAAMRQFFKKSPPTVANVDNLHKSARELIDEFVLKETLKS